MLRFYESIIGSKITSLHTGRSVAQVVDLVIDPNNLNVAALVCFSRAQDDNLYLLPTDIHEFSSGGISVQNEDALTSAEDLVKLQDLMQINFKLVGKKVLTDTKRKVGVVAEYVVDDESMKILKIHVRPPITKMINNSDRIIGRSQIIEVNDEEIIVRDTFETSKRLARAGVKT